MHLDPDVLLAKRVSVFTRWVGFAEADAAFDEWQEGVQMLRIQQAAESGSGRLS